MGGLGKCVTCQIFEFLFFCFLHRAPRSHFLTDRNDLYAITRVSGQGVPFEGRDNIRLHLGGQIPKKTSPKWAGIGTSQPNRRSSKIAIYRSPMKIFASNFTGRLITGTIQKNAKFGLMGS